MSMFLSGLATVVCHVISNRYTQTSARSLHATVLVAVLAMCVYGSLLLIFQRPVFALIASLSLLDIVLIVNKTKIATLREPLVASDFLMYAQVFRFPRLYLPFLNIASVVLLVVVFPILIAAALYLENRVAVHFPLMISIALLSGLLFYWISKRLKVSSDIKLDYPRFGLLACLAAYFVQSFAAENREGFKTVLAKHTLPSISEDIEQPNIVVIQSESFFDVRRLSSDIRSDILATYDEFCKEAHHAGHLQVPAWGANTLRTEFSFLSGMKNKDLGLYRYYPYFFMKRGSVQTLPKLLQEQGYKTICVHPYEKGFFGRHHVFEMMGFDEFIDIQQFHDAERFGPYVSDVALGHKITSLLKSATQPTFVFAITMENHGPLHLENIDEAEIDVLRSHNTERLERNLAIYARHIKNADKMLKKLKAYLTSSKIPAIVGFYGDHLPALTDCFKAHDFSSNDSDYFIWSNRHDTQTHAYDLAIEELASSIIHLINRAKKIT